MDREDVLAVFAQATEEQVDALLDAHRRELAGAQEAQRQLEQARGEAQGLREALEAREREDEARAQERDRQARRAELERRLDAAAGGRAFVHEFVRRGVLEAFARAVEDEANRGRDDGEILEALTRDGGCFASQNPLPRMPPMGDPDVARITDREAFRALPLKQQFLLARRDPERARRYLKED